VDPVEINRAHWETLASVHGKPGTYYDIDALVAGADSITDLEEPALGDLSGLDVLHIQCHIGFDTISLARRGARVTGADFSPTALAKASDLAERCGVEIEWVEAEATALPGDLRGRFDLAYASYGAICWIGDLAAWMRSAFGGLRGGGRLVLHDLHPLLLMTEKVDPLTFDFPYANDGGRPWEGTGTYADPDTETPVTSTVDYAHSLAEIVNSAIAAGFRVDGLDEHMDVPFDPRGDVLARDEDGRFRLRVGGELLPVMFTLRATRP
jgi:SAM-dependent methyltransferase